MLMLSDIKKRGLQYSSVSVNFVLSVYKSFSAFARQYPYFALFFAILVLLFFVQWAFDAFFYLQLPTQQYIKNLLLAS